MVAMLPMSAEAQQSRSFYDQRGSFAGSSVTRGNSTSVCDGRGSFAGSSIRNSGGTTSLTLQWIVHKGVAQTIELCLQVAKL